VTWESQTDWNGTGQCKRIKRMRKAACNVRTLYSEGAMNELVKEMGKYRVDICAVQEISWPGKQL
jgi:hypothetical protein